MLTTQEQLNNLKHEVQKCTKCSLCESRNKIVFSDGCNNAPIMFIGEAPGHNEDITGIPFIGRAGQLLRSFLFEVGFSQDDFYIANTIKCRPPKNRDPLPEEENACIDFLRRQLKLINPKIIVCLGRISATRLIKPDFKITSEHGKWFKKGDFLITAVYHPAFLLRDPRKKEDMLSDMKIIKAQLDAMNSGSDKN